MAQRCASRDFNRRFVVCLFLGILLLCVGACGPVLYVSKVTRGASSALESAKAAQADKYSPYYYTLAVEYLAKARDEASRSDFQAANRFGDKARWAAKKAKEEALQKQGAGEGVPSTESDSGEKEMAPLLDSENDEGADDADAKEEGEDDGEGDDNETP